MTEQTVCSSCGYKLKKGETLVNNRCPMCGKVFKNIKEKKEKDIDNIDYFKSNYKPNDEIKKTQTPKNISFKPLLIPLWILIIVNIVSLGYKIREVDGSKVTPVYIAGSKTLPISIEYASGNIPVVIEGPLSTSGSVCANPCR